MKKQPKQYPLFWAEAIRIQVFPSPTNYILIIFNILLVTLHWRKKLRGGLWNGPKFDNQAELVTYVLWFCGVSNFTSRKHGKKEMQSFSHCNSFDHHDFAISKQLQIFLFWFTNWKFKNLGAFNILLYRSWKFTFQRCITCPKHFKIAVIKPNKQICSRLLTADQGGQKNRNGTMTAILFYHVFY